MDFTEVLNSPDSAHEIEEFRRISLNLKKVFSDDGTKKLMELLKFNLRAMKEY